MDPFTGYLINLLVGGVGGVIGWTITDWYNQWRESKTTVTKEQDERRIGF